MKSPSKFPSSMAQYVDTRDAGSITIQGVELDTNEDKMVEAPANFAPEMEPHGFLLVGGTAWREWVKTQPAPVVETTKKK